MRAKRSLISEEELRRHIEALIDEIDIGETHLRFAATALDITTGSEFVLKTGPLRKALSASCAIPGILPPIKVNGHELVDGGTIDLVPVRVSSELGANLIIAVDVSTRQRISSNQIKRTTYKDLKLIFLH